MSRWKLSVVRLPRFPLAQELDARTHPINLIVVVRCGINDGLASNLAFQSRSRERPESALCSRWLTTQRMGEDAPKRTYRKRRIEPAAGTGESEQLLAWLRFPASKRKPAIGENLLPGNLHRHTGRVHELVVGYAIAVGVDWRTGDSRAPHH
jgi:hypothetical protein